MADVAPSVPSPAPATPRSRRHVWLKILGAWLAAMAVAFAGWTGWTMQQLRAAKERCRAAGLPMTLADLTPPPVPDDVNARTALEALAVKVKEGPIAAWLKSDDVTWLRELRNGPARALTDSETFRLAAILDQPGPKALLDIAKETAARQGYWPKP